MNTNLIGADATWAGRPCRIKALEESAEGTASPFRTHPRQ
jgi:hypothetical protein